MIDYLGFILILQGIFFLILGLVWAFLVYLDWRKRMKVSQKEIIKVHNLSYK